MTDDLVKRLRERDAAGGDYCTEWGEAADRIEKDAQHIDEMYALVAAMNADHTASKTRIEKLEAALKHCINALKQYEMGDDRPRGPIPNDDLRPWLLGAMDNAKKVLEGKDD